MSRQAIDIIRDRLLQAQGVLGALQAADTGEGAEIDPFVLSASLWAVQELLQQCIEAHEACRPSAVVQSEVEA